MSRSRDPRRLRRRLQSARQQFVATRKMRSGRSLPAPVLAVLGFVGGWSAALLILGLAYHVFVPAWAQYRHARGLLEQGVKADARIERLWATDLDWGDPNRSFRRRGMTVVRTIHYRFVDVRGLEHGRDERVDRQTYAPLAKGDEIDIVYSSTDPDDSLTEQRAERLASVTIELVLPGVILFGGGWLALAHLFLALRTLLRGAAIRARRGP